MILSHDRQTLQSILVMKHCVQCLTSFFVCILTCPVGPFQRNYLSRVILNWTKTNMKHPRKNTSVQRQRSIYHLFSSWSIKACMHYSVAGTFSKQQTATANAKKKKHPRQNNVHSWYLPQSDWASTPWCPFSGTGFLILTSRTFGELLVTQTFSLTFCQ